MFVLTSAKIYYGNRSIPMERNCYSKIPAAVESVDEIDLEAIGRDLNQFVFNKGGDSPHARRKGRSPATAWQLEVNAMLSEEAAELEAAMKADGIKLKGPITPAITVIGNGISLRYEQL